MTITLPITIPESHRDLLTGPAHGVLSTLMPDGQPQSSVVWVDYDGDCILLNTALERCKCRNMAQNYRVGLLVIDPLNGSRWISVRGDVMAITEDGAVDHADKLTRRYSDGEKQQFYGDVYPAKRRDLETRVIVKIRPVKVTRDAFFK